MNLKLIAAIVVVFAVAGGAYYFSVERAQAPGTSWFGGPPPAACTAEAKLCPDGTAVGRTGPRCEFAACPSATSTAALQACPEIKIVNAMPGPAPEPGHSEPAREYYLYQGQRREIAEFDAQWVGEHCDVQTEVAY